MKRPHWRALLAGCLLVAGWLSAGFDPPRVRGQDQPSLHERIDQIIESAAVGPIAPTCSDADFVRRIYLDLTGVIPTTEEMRAFLADESLDKRARLIEALLASPAFSRHMTLTLDVMLIERQPDKTNLLKPWLAYLLTSISANKPLDQLYREMLAADGADEALRPAARFTLGRDAEPNQMTRDIGRLAFGMDLQCAQCHDHPLIDDYYQADYYGLFAFVQRTSLFNDAKKKQMLLAEKADGEANYKSVFTGDAADGVRPQLPKGAVLYVEPTFAKGEEYVSAPAKDVRAVPKFSRRQALADMIPESNEFRRNVANRLWALMFGRGIVHPVDFHHVDNPPAHPELLTLLAAELQAGGFNLRTMLRELALTRAYQRSCDAPQPEQVDFAHVAERLAQLEGAKAERTAAVEPLKETLVKAKADRKAALDQNAGLAAQLKPLEMAVATAKTALDKAAADRKAAEDDLAKKRDQAQAVADAAAKAAEAVAKIPDDKILAEAAAKIAERAKELATVIGGAEKLVSERTAQFDTATAAHAAAEGELGKVAASRVPPEKLVELERLELDTAHQVADTQYGVAALDAQIATAKHVAEYAELAKSDPVKAEAAWSALVERWTIANQVAALRPLTPEQLAASAMRATGVLAAQEASAIAAIDKQPPDVLKNAADADKPRIRAEQIELRLIDQLDNTFAEFAKLYGGQSGQDFQATVNQSLFFGNGGTIDGWLKTGGESLPVRLGKLEDPAALADELYESVFSRPPADVEKQDVTDFLASRTDDKPIAISEMIWALLSSNEFRFNH
ncbi:MAG TPA: DUF1549 domain-containing protein [Pirellulaceae bacterium]|nr:DUF1549 domain-containing protein [Pirellulaceae bacterium]